MRNFISSLLAFIILPIFLFLVGSLVLFYEIRDRIFLKYKTIWVVFIIFLSFSSKAYAVQTGEIFPDNISYSGNWVNYNNLLSDPDSTYSSVTNQAATLITEFPSANLPEWADIIGLNFIFYSNTSGNTTNTQDIDLTIAGSPPDSCGGTLPYITISNSIIDKLVESANCDDFSVRATITNLNSGDFGIWIRNDGNQTISWDTISMNVIYTDPQFSIDDSNSTASPSAGLIITDLSGLVATTGADLKCDVSIFSKCTKEGYASDQSQTPIAHLQMSGYDPSDYTINNGNNYYTPAHDIANENDWYATDISLPYKPGWSCVYPISYSCYRQECSSYQINGTQHYTCGDIVPVESEQGINPNGENYNASLYFDPTASANTTALFEADCGSDWICNFKVWFKETAYNLFVPSSTLDSYAIDAFKDDLNSRAPFAYINSIYDLDFTDTQGSTDSPDIQLAFTPPQGNLTVNWTSNGLVESAVYSIRGIIQVVLWIIFIGYIIVRGRNLF